MHLHQDLPASSGQSLRRHDLLNFIATLYEGDLHAKRVLSLANATLGVLTSASLAIHAVGRGLAQALGTLTKHGVKQVDRLLSNRGVDVWTFFAYWTPFIVGARTEVIVALDWTSFAADGQDTIVLSMVTGHGRATPLLWKTVASSTLKNRHRFAYTTMVGLGLPRGSGAVESAIRRVINLRIKGASIYWLPESVDAILLLRSFYKSGRWNCLQRMAMTPVGVSA